MWSGAGQQLLGAGSVPALTRTVSVYTGVPAATSSVRTSASTTGSSSVVVPTTTTTTTTSTVPSGTPPAGAWQQCGGSGWSGPTSCVAGYTCNKVNDWYSQCQP